MINFVPPNLKRCLKKKTYKAKKYFFKNEKYLEKENLVIRRVDCQPACEDLSGREVLSPRTLLKAKARILGTFQAVSSSLGRV